MSWAKATMEVDRSVFRIEDPRRGIFNRWIGYRVRVVYTHPWPKDRPRFFPGDSQEGVLAWTFAKWGRTLLGILVTGGRTVSVPWSRNYIRVEVLGQGNPEDLRTVAVIRAGKGLPIPRWIGEVIKR